MGLVATDLANSIRSTMGFPLPTSQKLIGWAQALVSEIQSNAVIANPSVIGTCPSSGGSLENGAASSGTISNLSGSRLASGIIAVAPYPYVSNNLTKYCDTIVSHIMTGQVNFASGTITGTCTNSSLNPGTLTSGAGSNGTITGLNGGTLTSEIHSLVGYPGNVSERLIEFCTAIVDYIMSNADCIYSSGQVTGTCPSGGGSLSGGTASGGKIQ